MSNISTSINLAALKHSRMKMKGKSGMLDCLIIPIEANMLHKGEKGLYLNINHYEIKDKSKFPADSKDTHLVKQSFPKEAYDKLTEEEKKSFPIIGNSILWSGSSEAALSAPIGEDDDLPF